MPCSAIGVVQHPSCPTIRPPGPFPGRRHHDLQDTYLTCKIIWLWKEFMLLIQALLTPLETFRWFSLSKGFQMGYGINAAATVWEEACDYAYRRLQPFSLCGTILAWVNELHPSSHTRLRCCHNLGPTPGSCSHIAALFQGERFQTTWIQAAQQCLSEGTENKSPSTSLIQPKEMKQKVPSCTTSHALT